MRTVAVLSAVLLSSVLFAQDEIPERYQSIIDRQMFGRPPAGFDPAKPPSEVAKSAAKELTKEEEQLKSAVHFSVINITPDGSTAVGFTDSSDPKNPVGYYLKVGETKNGWTVKEADPVNASMTISKGELEVTLELGANSATTPSANAKADGKPAGAAGAGLLGSKPAGSIGSLRERRAAKDKERAANAEKERKEREERDAARQRELEEMKERIAQRQQDEEARQRELDETRNAIKELQQQIKDNDAQKSERQDEQEGGEGEGGNNDET